jgi:PD-(D/E)XK nuclease superfamily protein
VAPGQRNQLEPVVSAVTIVELPTSGRWPHISHSSLSMLTACERQWAFKYRDKLEAPPTSAMRKGSIFHRLWGAYWGAAPQINPEWAWQEETREIGAEWLAEHPDATGWPTELDDMIWLFSRYVEHYGGTAEGWAVEGIEVPFRVKLPGKYGWLVGYYDMLLRDPEGRLWIVELKTMGDFERLESYCWDPQLSIYYWVAREQGLNPWGLLLDAARTYRWKADRPTAESFERRWLDRNETHLEMAVREAVAGLVRAKALLRGDYPLRNVKRDCGWCPYNVPCREELTFGRFSRLPLEWEE